MSAAMCDRAGTRVSRRPRAGVEPAIHVHRPEDGPEVTITNLAAAIEAGQTDSLPTFFCPEQAGQAAQFDVSTLIAGLASLGCRGRQHHSPPGWFDPEIVSARSSARPSRAVVSSWIVCLARPDRPAPSSRPCCPPGAIHAGMVEMTGLLVDSWAPKPSTSPRGHPGARRVDALGIWRAHGGSEPSSSRAWLSLVPVVSGTWARRTGTPSRRGGRPIPDHSGFVGRGPSCASLARSAAPIGDQ
jgi:hypothetical protein